MKVVIPVTVFSDVLYSVKAVMWPVYLVIAVMPVYSVITVMLDQTRAVMRVFSVIASSDATVKIVHDSCIPVSSVIAVMSVSDCLQW